MSVLPAVMRTRQAMYVAIGAVAVCLGFAVPRLVGAFQGADPGEHPVAPLPVAPPASTPPGDSPAHSRSPAGDVPTTEEQAPGAAAEPTTSVATSKDGDLGVSVKLRWTEYESGDRVVAKVKFANHSMAAVFLPAQGEPDASLALVVEDADGAEVRRVVEAGRDQQFPRRMLRLASGAEAEFQVVVIAEDEAPLAPGNYTIRAELRPDPQMRRLGLATWTAPHGNVSSAPVPLVVTAKAH